MGYMDGFPKNSAFKAYYFLSKGGENSVESIKWQLHFINHRQNGGEGKSESLKIEICLRF